MALTINTNINSLVAQNNLSTNQATLATAMQRLSSGLRINSAKDDAAGLSIAERMTAQINGSNQAARNANDGISLAQTAEGDLSQIGANLQRMRELAVQSANGTNSASDRAALDNEVQALSAEIDRVAQSSSFNGVNLLNGSFTGQKFQVGANGTVNDSITVASIASARTSVLGGSATSTGSTVNGIATTLPLTAGSLTLNGQQIGAATQGAGPGQSVSSAYSIATAINAASTLSGVTATANPTTATGTTATLASNAVASGNLNLTVNGVQVGAIAAGGSAAGQGANVAAAINMVTNQSGVTATADAITGAVTLTAADGRDILLGSAFTPANSGFTGAGPTTSTAPAAPTTHLGLATGGTNTVNGIQIATIPATASVALQGAAVASAINAVSGQSGVTATADAAGIVTLTNATGGAIALGAGLVGNTETGLTAAANNKAATVITGTVSLTSVSASGITVGGGNSTGAGFTAGTTAAGTTITSNTIATINVLTSTNATNALAAIDGALTTINASRAALGAYQNRFSSVVASLQTTAQNLTASRSRIQDADFAAETATLSRSQILQQAGTAMVAQANSMPQSVLQLLK